MTKDWTYTITVPVKPTQAAVDYLLEHGNVYPDTGDSDTDVPGSSEVDWTSSGKSGFHSNANATLNFSSGETEGLHGEYPKPVIQVTTRSLSFKKVDSSSKTTALNGAEFILSKDESGTTVYLGSDGGWTSDKNAAKRFGGENVSEFTVDGLVVGETYNLVEVTSPDGYQLLSHPVVISGNAAAPTYNNAALETENTGQGAAVAGSVENPYLITNTTGAELPETGGPGTTIATIGGIALVAAAGCGYGLRRSRERRGAQS